MTDEFRYPDETAGPFPEPPERFEDREGREIVVEPYEPGDEEALIEMYATFDPADRAQGIPPATESQVRDWIGVLLEDGVDVLAWHDDRVVGHATLVDDDESGYELAIFVTQDYQRAGIGGRLIRLLLGEAARRGIERVWLTVERWNRAAVSLYEDVGFKTTDSESFELEMALRLE